MVAEADRRHLFEERDARAARLEEGLHGRIEERSIASEREQLRLREEFGVPPLESYLPRYRPGLGIKHNGELNPDLERCLRQEQIVLKPVNEFSMREVRKTDNHRVLLPE